MTWATEFLKLAAPTSFVRQNLGRALTIGSAGGFSNPPKGLNPKTGVPHGDSFAQRIGGGHGGPAVATGEVLMEHPDVVSGKVQVKPILPRTVANPDGTYSYVHHDFKGKPIESHPGELPPQKLDTIIGHGFSGVKGDLHNEFLSGEMTNTNGGFKSPFTTDNFYQALPDAAGLPKDVEGGAKHLLGGMLRPDAAAAHIQRNLAGTQNTIAYGPNASKWRGAITSDVSPFVRKQALDSMEDTLKRDPSQAQTLMGVAEHLIKSGDPQDREAAKRIVSIVQRHRGSTHVPVITGSTRGDQTAIRSHLLGRRLPDQDFVTVLGENGRTAHPLVADDHRGAYIHGGLEQKLYTDLRGTAGVNLGSTGAGDIAELRGLPVESRLMADPNAWRDAEMAGLEHRGKLRPWDKNVVFGPINTSEWNQHQIEEVGRGGIAGMGLHGYDNFGQEVQQALHNPTPKHILRARAEDSLRKLRLARENMADEVVRRTYDRAIKQSELIKTAFSRKLAAMAPAGSGLAGIGGGAMLAAIPAAVLGSGAGALMPVSSDDPDEALIERLRNAAIGAGAGGTAGMAYGTLRAAPAVKLSAPLNPILAQGLVGAGIGGVGGALTGALTTDTENMDSDEAIQARLARAGIGGAIGAGVGGLGMASLQAIRGPGGGGNSGGSSKHRMPKDEYDRMEAEAKKPLNRPAPPPTPSPTAAPLPPDEEAKLRELEAMLGGAPKISSAGGPGQGWSPKPMAHPEFARLADATREPLQRQAPSMPGKIMSLEDLKVMARGNARRLGMPVPPPPTQRISYDYGTWRDADTGAVVSSPRQVKTQSWSAVLAHGSRAKA